MQIKYIFNGGLLGTEEDASIVPQDGTGVMIGDQLYRVDAVMRTVTEDPVLGEFETTGIVVELVELS